LPAPNQFQEVPIFDSLHGFVRITLAEQNIINSAYFQRLRDIKQLSFAYYVFPGAVHTRFSHSIGVLATLAKVLERLLNSGAVIPTEDVYILRMAALLHDIGHYPLSHLIESSYQNHQDKFRLKLSAEDEEGGTDDALREYQERFPDAVTHALQHDGHHERLGGYIIQNTDFPGGVTYILKKNGFSCEVIESIALIIQGKSSTGWHNQIIHSELDVDRLDYLCRDSHATGVQYGNFDFEYLLNNFRLFKDEETNALIFSVKSSAVFTVEHFLLARYFWYAQIIHERTISIFDHLGTTTYQWLIDRNLAPEYVEVLQMTQSPSDFIKFNDIFFWEKIYQGTGAKYPTEDQETKNFRESCHYLINRIPLKRVRLPFSKTLKYKNYGCDHTETCAQLDKCHKSTGCPKFTDDRNVRDELSEVSERLKQVIIRSGHDPSWVIPLYKHSSISKLSTQRSAEEKERDPIRIIEDKKLAFLEDLEHSMVKMLNDYELVQPRIYVKQEYLEILEPTISELCESSKQEKYLDNISTPAVIGASTEYSDGVADVAG